MARTRNNPYLAPIGIGLLWLAVQAGLFFYGPLARAGAQGAWIVHGNDTQRYIDAAYSILKWKFPVGKAQGFLGYDLFVAFFLGSGLGEIGIVLAQCLLSLAAAYCLYRIGLGLCDEMTGLAAASIYLLYPDLQYWNFYLLSESLFVSMTVISLFLIVESKSWRGALAASMAAVFTSTVRPNGFIILLSAGVYLAYLLWKRRRLYALGGMGLALALLLPLVLKVVGGFWTRYAPLPHLAKGVVVARYKASHLVMPGAMPPGLEELSNPVSQALLFIAYKPAFFLKLAFWKLYYLFFAARPYYSDLHNYFLVATLTPIYVLAVWGAASRVTSRASRWLMLSLVASQCLVVVFTFVDSDNRLLLVILPVAFVFAARGASKLWALARDSAESLFRRRRSVRFGAPV